MKKEIKDNEILIFTDFNNTFVDFHAEYDYNIQFYDDFEKYLSETKLRLTKCLSEFERRTGLTPVICIVTNASLDYVDNNGFRGICYDLMMTYFNHGNFSKEKTQYSVEHSCEKYIKFVMHRENDGYLEINPYGKGMAEMFIPRSFGEETLKIKHPQVKRESVERFVSEFGPIKNRFVIFAGDSIMDDYPMKYAVSNDGINRIFIKPGKVQRLKPSVMERFCLAKGISFDCVNPKNNKKIKAIDETNLHLLTEEQKQQLLNFDDGDTILLTSPNSRGFVEGIYKSIDVINGLNDGDKERTKNI